MQDEKLKAGKARRIKEKGKVSPEVWIARMRWFCKEILWGCAAWLLGQAGLLFDTYPLGFALLLGSSGHTLPVLIGLLLTSFSNMQTPILYICVYLAAALFRLVIGLILDAPDTRFTLPEELKKRLLEALDKKTVKASSKGETIDQNTENLHVQTHSEAMRSVVSELRDVFNNSLKLRMATAAVCGLVVSLYRVIAGEFSYYDWFAALFTVVMTVVATAVFSISFEKRTELALLMRFSEAALLFSIVYSARAVTFFSFPLAPMAALFFTLYACTYRTGTQGICASILCGWGYSILHAPGFLLAALVRLFFKQTERTSGAVLLPIAAILTWSTYVSKAGILLSLLPAALLSGGVFTVLQKSGFFQETQEKNKTEADGGETCAKCGREKEQYRIEKLRYRDSNERFRGISDAFSSLSEVFYNLSDRFRRPGTLDLRRLCDRSFDTFCEECPNKNICWGLEYSETLGAVNDLISQLHTKGRVSGEQVPEQLRHRCTRMEGILDEINSNCAKLTGEMLRNNRTEIFAMDYESAANIINDALEEDHDEYRFDHELEKKVGEYLKDADVHAEGVTVYGRRCRRILIKGADIEHAKVTFETMRCDLGEMCASEFGQPSFEIEGNVSTMILQAKRKIGVLGAQNNVSADGGVSGDSVNLFSNKKDYFYALISDGMGAGKEAALTSGLCSVFMEKMLRAGNRAGTSLRMLNNMIASRGSDSTKECSSTVDLLELDLMTGNAAFIKSGAAPSFVIRGGVVRKMQSGTVPIGILNTLDAQKTGFLLREGDTVVMISDGVLQSDEDGEWLTTFLAETEKLTPEEIVYQICLHSAERETHDDCSAIALRIVSAEEKGDG